MKKAKTMNLKGNEYAKVAERIRIFREENPKGSITTTPEVLSDGQLMFKAYVVKDKANTSSADATGHALSGEEALKGSKAFEKIETVAVGRALANLGYLASGEVASAEEMVEFLAYQEGKQKARYEELEDRLKEVKTVEECRDLYKEIADLGQTAQELIVDRKNQLSI